MMYFPVKSVWKIVGFFLITVTCYELNISEYVEELWKLVYEKDS